MLKMSLHKEGTSLRGKSLSFNARRIKLTSSVTTKIVNIFFSERLYFSQRVWAEQGIGTSASDLFLTSNDFFAKITLKEKNKPAFA